jgi:hypothetical protein
MFWRLRYRHHGQVDTGVIQAPDFQTAERVGQRFCEKGDGPSFIYVRVEPWLLADETILAAEPPREDGPEPVKPQDEAVPLTKPTIAEQKERAKERRDEALQRAATQGQDAEGQAAAALAGGSRKPARIGA